MSIEIGHLGKATNLQILDSLVELWVYTISLPFLTTPSPNRIKSTILFISFLFEKRERGFDGLDRPKKTPHEY